MKEDLKYVKGRIRWANKLPESNPKEYNLKQDILRHWKMEQYILKNSIEYDTEYKKRVFPMLVEGYRYGADFAEAARSIAKHTGYNLNQAKKICEDIKNGKAVSLPNDFVLREELKECKITVA